ncbi:uncharacterized protein [Danio rerio]|uniref:Uncharacterized protein n=1 Tax=Danio rerio TaxID=7955 RepID=A0AC58HE94_DANRE|nr:uncharacterized protein LOC108179048 [Danio rerio]|eukprot:XP_021322242.1 uncharacterized protein LOC108179048 [Danio rerio]
MEWEAAKMSNSHLAVIEPNDGSTANQRTRGRDAGPAIINWPLLHVEASAITATAYCKRQCESTEPLSRNGERGGPRTQRYYARHAIQLAPAVENGLVYETGKLNQVDLSSLESTAVHSTPLTSTLMCLLKDKCFISADSHSAAGVLKHADCSEDILGNPGEHREGACKLHTGMAGTRNFLAIVAGDAGTRQDPQGIYTFIIDVFHSGFFPYRRMNQDSGLFLPQTKLWSAYSM